MPISKPLRVLSLTMMLSLSASYSYGFDMLKWMGMLGDSGKGKVAHLEFHLRDGFVPTSVQWSPDGHRLATAGGEGGAIHIWDMEQHKLLKSLDESAGNAAGNHDLAWSGDGRYLAHCNAAQGSLRVYDASDWHVVKDFPNEQIACASLAFSSDSQQLSVLGKHNLLTLSSTDWSELRKIELSAAAATEFSVLAYVPATHVLALGGLMHTAEGCPAGTDKSGRVWIIKVEDKNLGSSTAVYCAPRGAQVAYLAFDPNARQMATSTATNTETAVLDSVHILSYPDKQLLAAPLERYSTHRPQALSYTPDGKYLLVGMGDSGSSSVYIIDSASLQVLDTVHAASQIHDIAIHPQNTMFAAASGKGVTVWKFK